MRKPLFVPLGRLSELLTHVDAERMAYSISGYDAKVITYASRAALEVFCRDGSAHHALVKTLTHKNMIVNRNTQTHRTDL